MARSTTTTRRPASRSIRKSTRAAQRRSARPATRSTSARRVSKARAAGRSASTSAARRQGRMAQAGSFTRPASPGEEAAIQRFLDGFTRALTSGDGTTAAECFEYPALMVMSAVGEYGGNRPLQDQESVAAFFDQAPWQYQAKGIHETTANIDDIQWVSDDLALVRVEFPYLDEDGNDMGDGETSIYLVRRTGRDYAICAAITLGAESDRAAA